MANTAITLTLEEGILVPSQPSVPFISGNSVSFSTGDGSPGFLFFSPDAALALAPTPTHPYALDGSKAEFTFITSNPGQYSVYFETDESATPPPFPPGSLALLLLEIDDSNSGGFGGPDSGMKKPTGS
jgi:hypothetical protein